MTGLIGGSGLYEIEGLSLLREVPLSTPFGEPSAPYRIGSIGGSEVVFLARHGSPHRFPPHRVNYRANIWGFKALGVERIITVSAVGGINRGMPPGSLILLDQLIDMTCGTRPSTFYEGDRVVHVDFTDPYCTVMRECILAAARDAGLPLTDGGTYVCVNGPRLETAKEIQFFASIGADVVGMTAMPEASLAREAELCLAGIAVVTNRAAGISGGKLTTTEVVETMRGSLDAVKSLLGGVLLRLPSSRGCTCKNALQDSCL
ncbi:MAG: S-methyl-5'-thioadenosine phosphorylase [Nitrospirales bacterium]|nr:S-methyl-5'-thioadenosine phosphorylase [Nitrospirales bacterium]